MVRWPSPLAMAVVALVLLSGCSGGPSKGNGPDSVPSALQVEDVHVESGSKLGAISGVVVDAAIRPVRNATVEVRGLGSNLTTGPDGTFAVKDLEPGVYFIATKAKGFLAVQTSAQVVAGEVATVRILLQDDPTPQPYHSTIKFEGFIQFNPAAAGYLADILLVDELNQSICTCVWRFDSGNATTIVFEMVWIPSTAPPTGDMDLYYQMYEENKVGIHIQSEYVKTPYVVHVDREKMWGNWTYFRVHFGGSSKWVNVNQQFTSYATFFYNGEAPKDWSFVAGDQ